MCLCTHYQTKITKVWTSLGLVLVGTLTGWLIVAGWWVVACCGGGAGGSLGF
jgi:hypothetical protein